MTFGPENELSVYHGVEGSTKQPGSTKQAKCSGGEGGGTCLSAGMNFKLR